MYADGSIVLDWGGGEVTFRLGIGQLLALEERFDCGAIEILDRFAERRWRVAEAREILRLGLIGGGLGMEAANRRVASYFEEMGVGPLEHGPFAQAVLASGLMRPKGFDLDGDADDASGKATAAASKTEADASTPPPSSAQAQSSDGRPTRSKRARSRSLKRPSKAGTKDKTADRPSSP